MAAEKKVYCNKCKNETHHSVIKESKKDSYNDIEFIHYFDIYQIIQCDGCKEISFCHTAGNDDNYHPETDERYESKKNIIYPERDSYKLEIKNRPFLPINIRKLYRETIIAFNNKCNILCTIGLRAIVEAICDEEGVERNRINSTGKEITMSLKERIKKLIEKHTIAEILDKHRELGNDSAHDFTEHSAQVLILAIMSVDNILNVLYENKEINASLNIK